MCGSWYSCTIDYPSFLTGNFSSAVTFLTSISFHLKSDSMVLSVACSLLTYMSFWSCSFWSTIISENIISSSCIPSSLVWSSSGCTPQSLQLQVPMTTQVLWARFTAELTEQALSPQHLGMNLLLPIALQTKISVIRIRTCWLCLIESGVLLLMISYVWSLQGEDTLPIAMGSSYFWRWGCIWCNGCRFRRPRRGACRFHHWFSLYSYFSVVTTVKQL